MIVADSQKVTLDVFEGPLDLLLHLIRKEDVDIQDIPIARLLESYLGYLDLAKELNIDLAGEFIEMAAELAYIKSKMLLPEPTPEPDEGPDPREELMRRLLEYQRFKEVAQGLLARPLLGNEVFRRPQQTSVGIEEETLEVDTISLLSAFQDLLKRLSREKYHEISQPRMGVSERIVELTEKLQGKERVSFEDLFEADTRRIDLVITFLAVLEMAKQGLLRIIQEKVFHRIVVCPHIERMLQTSQNNEEINTHDGT